jgi:hypothetical protein
MRQDAIFLVYHKRSAARRRRHPLQRSRRSYLDRYAAEETSRLIRSSALTTSVTR